MKKLAVAMAWRQSRLLAFAAMVPVVASAGVLPDGSAMSAPEAPFKMPDVPVWRVPSREFPITDYGAVTGAVKNTEAFAKGLRPVPRRAVDASWCRRSLVRSFPAGDDAYPAQLLAGEG